MAAGGLTIKVQGLRNVRGRFASMAERGVAEIAFAKAEDLASTVAEEYKRGAPRSKEGGGKFADSFHGKAEEIAGGFRVQIETSQEQLRIWLLEGTRDHGPVTAKALHFEIGGESIFAKHVRGLGPKGSGKDNSHWEAHVRDRLDAVVTYAGNRIGVQVVERLGGRF